MADNYTNFFDVETPFLHGLMGHYHKKRKIFYGFCASNSDMQEIMEANDQLDETYESIVEDGYELPQEILDDLLFHILRPIMKILFL